MTTSTTLGHALAFAARNIPVVPLHWPEKHKGRPICSCGKEQCTAKAKHPFAKLAPRGVLSATTDTGIIKGWFGYQEPRANLGIATDTLIALDIDPRHDGDRSLRELEREHGELPPTWHVLTGGGGVHVIFSAPPDVHVSCSQARDTPVLGPGVDIRARGGYLVAPPSKHILGRPYAFDVDFYPGEVPLAEPPAWLIDRLATRSADGDGVAVASEEWARLIGSPVTEYRDAAAARIAGHLLRRWVDPALAGGLLAAWNMTCCHPPLPDDELRRILDRIADLEADRRERRETSP
jgi:hypothetical protein